MIQFIIENEQDKLEFTEELSEIMQKAVATTLQVVGGDEETDFEVRTATLDEPECGLTQDVIDNTDAIERKQKELEKLNKKMDNYLDMRSDGEISKEIFLAKTDVQYIRRQGCSLCKNGNTHYSRTMGS